MSEHLPALSPEALQLALQQISRLNVSNAAKRQLAAMLLAAADPNSERLDVVIGTLPQERREEVEQASAELSSTFADVEARGATALLSMDEDTWQALIDEAT